MKNKNKKMPVGITFLTHSAIIAAAYVALTLLFAFCASGTIQVRVSEALCVLPYFTPAAIPGLAIGCLIANILTGSVLWDVVFGSLATLIGAVFSYLLRKRKWLVPIPPIVANVLIIPQVLKYVYGASEAVPFLMMTVGIGEVVSVGILGMLLLFALEKNASKIFKNK